MSVKNHILFVGDIMPGGFFHYMENESTISSALRNFMLNHSLRIGTLESAIGNDYEFDKVKIRGRNNLIYSKNEDIELLKYLHIDVVSLANNHTFDLCEDGLLNTIDICNKHGIKTCGAGKNIEESRNPAIVIVNGKSIAFLAYCAIENKSMGYVKYATSDEPGIAPLILDFVREDIEKCKKKYHYVIVLPHWGEEENYFPFPSDVSLAKRIIDFGADAVIGSHTHRISPNIKYKCKPIFFSLGNFMFPDYYMVPPRPISYPSPDDVTRFKRVLGYPFPIECPSVQVWEGKCRIGMAASISIDNLKAKYQLTCLSSSNLVSFFHRWSFPLKRIRMKIMGLCITSRYYEWIYSHYYSKKNYLRNAIHWIVKKMHINFDEPIGL